MNSGTLVGSLIFAAVLVVAIAVAIQLMMLGWRRRAQRQAGLIGDLPDMPDEVGGATAAIRGVYVGSTLAPEWNDRITAGDLGYRSKAALTRYPEGIMLERVRAKPIWIPQESITAVRTERGIAGKVAARNGILAIRWRLPSGVEIDTGFRAGNRSEYGDWLGPRPEGQSEPQQEGAA
ncbi:MAG: transporter [Mycobacterium sp.]